MPTTVIKLICVAMVNYIIAYYMLIVILNRSLSACFFKYRSLWAFFFLSFTMCLVFYIVNYVPGFLNRSLWAFFFISFTMCLFFFIVNNVPGFFNCSLCAFLFKSFTMCLFVQNYADNRLLVDHGLTLIEVMRSMSICICNWRLNIYQYNLNCSK